MFRKQKSLQWSPTTKLLISTVLLVVAATLLVLFSEVIPPLIVACILGFVLSPIVKRVEGWLKIKRVWATLIVYFLMIGLASLIPILIVPILVDQFGRLNVNIQEIIATVENLLAREVVIGDFSIDLAAVYDQFAGSLQNLLEPYLGQTLGIAFDVIGSAVWAVFILVISFYLVKDGAQFWRWLEGLVPPMYREDYVRLREEVYIIWSSFFRGQLILAFVVSILFIVIGLIIGIPFAVAMAVFAGLMEFIPSIGHGIWLFVASLLVFFRGSTWLPLQNWLVMVILISLHLIFEQVDLNFLIPRIIGRRVRLHPLVVILGIIIGAVLAGVLGVVLAAPSIASIRVIGRYVYARLFDLDPYPIEENETEELKNDELE
jgi:predicted PurR-regulated permease PerM